MSQGGAGPVPEVLDVWSIRAVVVGLVVALLVAVLGMCVIGAGGGEIPPAISGVAGTLAGGLVGMLVPVSRGR